MSPSRPPASAHKPALPARPASKRRVAKDQEKETTLQARAGKTTRPGSGVVVVGSLNMDLVVKTETMPLPGQTVLGQDFQQVPGGKGANQAAAAGLLAHHVAAGTLKTGSSGTGGGGCSMIGRIGDDLFGQRMLENLHRFHVATSTVLPTPKTPSGIALIVVDRHGENSIVVAGGANNHLSSNDLIALRKTIESHCVLAAQLETPYETVACAIALARRCGTLTILDPAPAPPEGLPDALYHVDILTPNQTEAHLLTGITIRTPDDARRAGERILARGTGLAIIKMGAGGAVIIRKNNDLIDAIHVPGFKVKAVDTTAAGDCFNGALATALAEGQELVAAVRFANAAGALACTKFGAQSSIPNRAQVNELIAPPHGSTAG